MSEPIAVLLNQAASNLRIEWENMVSVALCLEKEQVDDGADSIARAGKCGYESVRRKLYAIQHAARLGYSQEEIVSMGQERVLGDFQKKTRSDTYETQTWMKFRVQGSIRQLVTLEIERVSKVLHFKTSEMFFEWLLAQLHNTTDDELRQSAGMSAIPRQSSQGGAPK
jgi:hypothetical protein